MVLDNLSRIRERIDVAARKSGRDPGKVELVAVTKYASVDAVRELLKSGKIRYFGENRIQAAAEHIAALGADAKAGQWRFIGHLQTNKAPKALELFDWIDSVDSLKLAQALDKQLAKTGERKKVLIRVKLVEKETQSGIAPEALSGFLKELKSCETLVPCGLMTIAPMLEPVEAVRPYFKRMKELLDQNFSEARGEEGPHLSMGMSRDYEVAVEEGATS
jgi:PLP dependent protein